MDMTREELLKLSKEELIDVHLGVMETFTQKIAALEARVKELEARVNMNSQNSSKPPSSDGYKKPPSQRQPSGKAPGGQHGHKGHGPKLPHAPDVFEIHKPPECENCPHAAECEKRQRQCLHCHSVRYPLRDRCSCDLDCDRASDGVCGVSAIEDRA